MPPQPPFHQPRRIVSGGQTGVDRGALEAAIALGIEHGGWCPRGRRAEDGTIPSKYQLCEMQSHDYADRTEQNVIDSDATLILYLHKLSGGTLLTKKIAQQSAKPHLLLRLDRTLDCGLVRQWLDDFQPQVLNVAGPRESTAPGIQKRSMIALLQIFSSSHGH